MSSCIHLVSGNGVVCVRGTSSEYYAMQAAADKAPEALRLNITLSVQRYGERMTVRPAAKCKKGTAA